MKFIKYILLVVGLFLLSLGVYLDKKNIDNKYYDLTGSWLEESGSLFIIKEDCFYWYKDYNDLDDNYYKGKISYKRLEEFNYTDEYIKENYGDIDKDLLYIIKLYPSFLVRNGNKKELDASYSLLFELLLEDNKYEGSLYSKNLFAIYKIIKYGN